MLFDSPSLEKKQIKVETELDPSGKTIIDFIQRNQINRCLPWKEFSDFFDFLKADLKKCNEKWEVQSKKLGNLFVRFFLQFIYYLTLFLFYVPRNL